jgi:hypothetical protein
LSFFGGDPSPPEKSDSRPKLQDVVFIEKRKSQRGANGVKRSPKTGMRAASFDPIAPIDPEAARTRR